uniref:Galectin n=1 Tax=Pyxicephalus adspersus TaxID=30357 RepID=A0AAV3ALB0_PYXAD|nr:TPA: hypothetical protein GDO54_000042 [Pyxicephalus adspersus]
MSWLQGHCSFSIGLGIDSRNFLLHFSPRFDFGVDKRKIVCNSLQNNVWEQEQKEGDFPFQQGSVTTVRFEYRREDFNILLPSGKRFSFPVRFNVGAISYLTLGNLQLKCLTIE